MIRVKDIYRSKDCFNPKKNQIRKTLQRCEVFCFLDILKILDSKKLKNVLISLKKHQHYRKDLYIRAISLFFRVFKSYVSVLK